MAYASGLKAGKTYVYLQSLTYDKFEQRVALTAGNGITTRYTYDPANRRLVNLQSGQGQGNAFQNLLYGYDPVGNILSLENRVAVPPPSQFGGPTTQSFVYDDLYRLTSAQGTYGFAPNKHRDYSLTLAYDSIHNILNKQQADSITQPGSAVIPQKKTSYVFDYQYTTATGGSGPHAPIHIGDRTFSYDANGNQLGWDNDTNGTRRTITWDEDNRIASVADNGHTMTYVYDDQGQRILKYGPQGETAYVNPWFTIRNREIATKNVYAGTTRLVSKFVKQTNQSLNGTPTSPPTETDQYFYHPDHLGSTAYVTDAKGQLYQHLEYFPFGETWVEEASNTQRTPYLYTAKELDEETGLYYYGARYYDPRTSVWQSADPAFARFLPGGRRNVDALPGLGGVFNTKNINVYNYSGQNPIIFVDPNGEDQFLYFWKPENTSSGAGHVAHGIGTVQSQVMYESNPTTSAPKAPIATPYKETGSMQQVVSRAHNQNRPDLILQLKTSAAQDKATIAKLDEFFAKNKDWKVFSTNCTDMCKLGLSTTDYDIGLSPVIASPVELSQDLFENNPAAVKRGEIKVISGDWKAFREGTGSVRGVVEKTGSSVGQAVKEKAQQLWHSIAD